MNISKGSWHYRCVDAMFVPSKSLCLYFWQMIYAICYKLIIYPAIIFVVIIPIVGGMLYAPALILGQILFALKIDSVLYLTKGEGLWQYTSWQVLAVGIAFWTLLCCFIACLEYRKRCVVRGKPATVLGSWIKAKKSKVCPIITFKE